MGLSRHFTHTMSNVRSLFVFIVYKNKKYISLTRNNTYLVVWGFFIILIKIVKVERCVKFSIPTNTLTKCSLWLSWFDLFKALLISLQYYIYLRRRRRRRRLSLLLYYSADFDNHDDYEYDDDDDDYDDEDYTTTIITTTTPRSPFFQQCTPECQFVRNEPA